MCINILYILHTYTHLCKYISNISEHCWLTSIYPLQFIHYLPLPCFLYYAHFLPPCSTCCLDCNCLMSLTGLIKTLFKKPFGNQENVTAYVSFIHQRIWISGSCGDPPPTETVMSSLALEPACTLNL